MRKLILAPMALACLIGVAQAQQAPSFNIGNFPSTWSVTQSGTWDVGLRSGASVLSDLRVAGSAVASGNPVPVSVGNAFALDATITGRLGTLGQKAAAGSAPVVLATDQPALPLSSGAATAANQATAITSLQAIAARSATTLEISKTNLTANSFNYLPSRSLAPGYSRINYTIGCSAPATLYVNATANGFTSYVTVGSVTAPAGSDTPASSTTPAIGGTISVPAIASTYQGLIAMGGIGGTCTVMSSQTAN